MKNFIFGILFLFTINTTGHFVFYTSKDDKISRYGFYVTEVLRGQGIVEVVSGRCRDNFVSSNGTPVRKWFNCNKLQIFFSDLIYEKTETK